MCHTYRIYPSELCCTQNAALCFLHILLLQILLLHILLLLLLHTVIPSSFSFEPGGAHFAPDGATLTCASSSCVGVCNVPQNTTRYAGKHTHSLTYRMKANALGAHVLCEIFMILCVT